MYPEPAPSVPAVISQHHRLLPDVARDDVDVAVVVQVAEGGAAAGPVGSKDLSRSHADEARGLIPQQQRRLAVAQIGGRLLDCVHHVSLRHEDILPAIVVVVEETRAPARIWKCGATHARRVGDVSKRAVAVVAKQPVALVGEVGDEDIGTAVVVVVRKVHAHAGKGLSVLVVSHAGQQGHLGERAVSVVPEQERLHGVVGDVHVHEPVVVEISEGDAESFADRTGNSGFLRYVGERAVAVVAIEDVGQSLEVVGVTVSAIPRLGFPTVSIGTKGPVHVARDEEVEPAVVVVVQESGAGAPLSRSHSGDFRHVDERAVPVVTIERVSAVVGDVDVCEAVVVVVADRDAHAVVVLRHAGETGLLRHVGKRAL